MSVLTLQPGKNNKVHLLLDGEYAMTADSDFVAFSGLHNNMILDDEALTDLQGKVNARRAFNKASDLLALRDHSEKELLQKLRQKGFADGAEEAMEKPALPCGLRRNCSGSSTTVKSGLSRSFTAKASVAMWSATRWRSSRLTKMRSRR